GADVPGDALAAPAEVVHAREVDELVVALLVAEVRARPDDPGGVDDERGLAVCLDRLDDPGYAGGHSATPRIPEAGGTPARIFSWSRTMPSISASGRGGHPGTWMSTGTILSTPWSTV